MKLTQRQATFLVLILQIVGSVLGTLSYIQDGDSSYIISSAISTALFASLLFLYWRGWEPARYIIIVAITIVMAFGTREPFVSQQIAFSTLIPSVIALILASPIWVVGSAATILVIFLIRSEGQGVYANPINLVIMAMVVGGMILARFVTDTALRSAQENAERASEEKKRAEEHAEELARVNELINKQLEQQKELLSLVMTLETPVVPLADGVLLAPIVGHIDTRRADTLTKRMLQAATSLRAQLVVLDIAGVAMVDTAVARALIQAVQALRLLGCEVVLSGISANVAVSLIHLGVDLEGIKTVRSPQEALANYLLNANGHTPSTLSNRTERTSVVNKIDQQLLHN